MQINNLAASVIILALKDYIESGAARKNKKLPKFKRMYAESMYEECEMFLLGKTAISRHWYACYDAAPMTRAMLTKLAASGVFAKEIRKEKTNGQR